MLQVLSEGKGELVVMHRATSSHQASDYLPCIFCYGFFRICRLGEHVRNCKLNLHPNCKQEVHTNGLLILSPYLVKEPFQEELFMLGAKETSEEKGALKTYLTYFL